MRRQPQFIEHSTNSPLSDPTKAQQVDSVQVYITYDINSRIPLVDVWNDLPKIQHQLSQSIYLRAWGMDAKVTQESNGLFLRLGYDGVDLMLQGTGSFVDHLWPSMARGREVDLMNPGLPCRVMFLQPPLVPLPRRLLVFMDVGTHWERVGLVRLEKESVHQGPYELWERVLGRGNTSNFDTWLDGKDFDAWVQSLPLALQEICIG